MKRSTRQTGGPSRGKRLRLALLLATAAAFLLVPAAQAFAKELTVHVEGTGAGKVTSNDSITHGSEDFGVQWEGEPAIECSYASPGPTTGACENSMAIGEQGEGTVLLKPIAAPGSEFVEWRKGSTGVYAEGLCTPGELEGLCVVYATREEPEAEAIAVFNTIPPLPKFSLNLTTSGTGSGSFKCKVNGGSEETCEA